MLILTFKLPKTDLKYISNAIHYSIGEMLGNDDLNYLDFYNLQSLSRKFYFAGYYDMDQILKKGQTTKVKINVNEIESFFKLINCHSLGIWADPYSATIIQQLRAIFDARIWDIKNIKFHHEF